MTDLPVDASDPDSADAPAAAMPPVRKQVRRTMLSTGFSDVPGKTCEICGFQGFRWQTECPEGHPLG